LIDDPANDLLFSVASLWEVAIKNTQGRADFQVDPGVLCRNLVSHGYTPLPIKAEHAVAIGGLPNHHKDPFDRMLVAQAIVEGVTLVTADPIVARYPGAIRQV
jgi:PIN domain nuclease of toxin-antitoxin system